MGVESGSQRILDAMDKGTRIGQVRTATRLLRSHGIRVAWFLQLGYTGETWADLLATRDLVRSGAPGRRRRLRRLSAARHALLRTREGAARRAHELERQRRARDDVPRDVHERASTGACATSCTRKSRRSPPARTPRPRPGSPATRSGASWTRPRPCIAPSRSRPRTAPASASRGRDAGRAHAPPSRRRPGLRRPRPGLRRRVRGLDVRRGAAPGRPPRAPRGVPARRASPRARAAGPERTRSSSRAEGRRVHVTDGAPAMVAQDAREGARGGARRPRDGRAP